LVFGYSRLRRKTVLLAQLCRPFRECRGNTVMLAPKKPALVHPHRGGWEGECGHDKGKPGQCASHITPYLLAMHDPRFKSLRSGFFGTSPPRTARQLNWSHFRRYGAFSPQWLIFCEPVEPTHPAGARKPIRATVARDEFSRLPLAACQR